MGPRMPPAFAKVLSRQKVRKAACGLCCRKTESLGPFICSPTAPSPFLPTQHNYGELGKQ